MLRTVLSKPAAFGLILLMAIGSVAMWLVVPVAWLYVGSHLQKGSQPSLGPYVLIMIGIPVSMVVIGKLLSKTNRLYGRVTNTTPNVRVVAPWHKSMRAERESGHQATVLDVVMIASVSIALTAFGVWFFVFAGSSLPG